MEPVDGVLPGFDVPGKLCGLQLNKTGMLEEEDSYAVTAFYSIPNSGYASAEFLVFNDNPVLLEEGRLRLPRGNSVEVLCLERADAHEASERVKEEFGVQAINLSAGEFRAKIEQYRDQSGKTGLRVRRVKEILPYIREPTDQGEDLDYLSEGLEKQFGKINNLAINTINYINAQNVTLVPRTRKIKTITRSRKGREIVHNAEMPYHIVGIESRTQVVDQEREDNGSLRWRVYVRGHNRRIRDEKGSIKYVTWVHPHVKGPENAPWRDHRYAVLAGMLERERTMLSDYLPPKVA
ncbi:hypothetical protein HYT24_01280 [Candidatus Pacearchaeota archaeon]|nr:hypothetical protein [Candidatus Pacearchaeota archaeon]